MLTGELKSRIDGIWNAFWSGGIANPLEVIAKQTTGIASINMTQLRGFPLLVPPRPLQCDFVRRIDVINKLKTTLRASLSQLDALFASLQHRAFRGEL